MSSFRAARSAVFALVSSALACTSADFATAPPETTDTGVTPGDGSGPDAPTDPCVPVPGIAKFCISIAKVDPHPGYDPPATTGANVLGIDGLGVFKVYLYSENPSDPTRTTPLKPSFKIAYPSDGSSLNVDEALPLSIASSAPEGGHYWFTVVFEDNAGATRPDNYAAVPGDFIVVPPVMDNKLAFPEITLKKDETQVVAVSIKPIRQVAANVAASVKLVGLAKSTKPEIHGDGPLAFLIYTGTIGDKGAVYYDLAYAHCIDLEVKGLAETVPVTFGTVLGEGKTYKILGVQFDYDYPPDPPPSGKSEFPGKGSIISPLTDVGVDRVATLSLTANRWLAATDVTMADVPLALTTDTVEKQFCPGAK